MSRPPYIVVCEGAQDKWLRSPEEVLFCVPLSNKEFKWSKRSQADFCANPEYYPNLMLPKSWKTELESYLHIVGKDGEDIEYGNVFCRFTIETAKGPKSYSVADRCIFVDDDVPTLGVITLSLCCLKITGDKLIQVAQRFHLSTK